MADTLKRAIASLVVIAFGVFAITKDSWLMDKIGAINVLIGCFTALVILILWAYFRIADMQQKTKDEIKEVKENLQKEIKETGNKLQKDIHYKDVLHRISFGNIDKTLVVLDEINNKAYSYTNRKNEFWEKLSNENLTPEEREEIYFRYIGERRKQVE